LKCDEGHEWEARVADRTKEGRGCPYCCNQKINKENCLASDNPELTLEWDFERNKLTPYGVAPRAKYKVWWICPNGHSYQAKIYHRNGGVYSGCPKCCQGVVLKDGTSCDSILEAYFYTKYQSQGRSFLFNNVYGGSLGKRRYDFYFPCENLYVEVTSFLKNDDEKYLKFYHKYMENIKLKRAYVEKIGAKFLFVQKRLSPQEIQDVKRQCKLISTKKTKRYIK